MEKLSANELLAPAKTEGELMSYRQGYSIGLAAGKRQAHNDVIEKCAKAIEPANHPLLQAAAQAIRALKTLPAPPSQQEGG